MILSLTAVIALANPLFGQIDAGVRPKIVNRVIIVPKVEFNIDHVRRLAQQFLNGQDGAAASILRLLMVPDETSRASNFIHGLPGVSYTSTVDLIRQAGGLPKGPLARLFAMSGAAKLSYVDQGDLAEELLTGTADPTILRDNSYTYEFLHFTMTEAGAALRGDKLFLDVYLKASPRVSVSSSVRVFDTLREITKVQNLTVHVRSDAWFMGDPEYPLVPAFTRPLIVPNELEYKIAPQLDCSVVRGRGVRCAGQNFAP